MPTIIEVTLSAANQVFLYGDKLLKDIRPEHFARMPVANGKPVQINHPAFQYGHLGLYPQRLAGVLGLPVDGLAAPEGWMDLFKIGSQCHNDPDGSIYPAMEKILTHFSASTKKVLSLLPQVPDSQMLSVNTDERSKERFPVLGSFVIYLLTAHPNTHFGQVSAWRRCMGLGTV